VAGDHIRRHPHTLLAVACMIDLNDKIKPVNVLSVSIQEPAPAQPSPEKENPAQGNPSSSVTKQQNDPTPMMPGAKIQLTGPVSIRNTFIT
jgi:hypothetical protein